MRSSLIWIVAIALTGIQAAADRPNKSLPRFKARVVCFNGKIDSGSSCSASCYQPDGKLHEKKRKLRCGYPGRVSELEWSFVAHRDGHDVYRFTRRSPADTDAVTTKSKNIEFSDSRVICFEDEFQVVVLEPPKKE